MARAKLSVGIDSLSGKLAKKSGMQMRFKRFKDDTGHVIGVGPQEFFHRNTRDYKQSPRTVAEQAQAEIWKVCVERQVQSSRTQSTRGMQNCGHDGMRSSRAEVTRF